MKTKQIERKLVLKKESIAQLTGMQMLALRGGIYTDNYKKTRHHGCSTCKGNSEAADDVIKVEE